MNTPRKSPGAGQATGAVLTLSRNDSSQKDTCNTWSLPLLKRLLLDGERVTQAQMLERTGGRAWRLSAAVYYLSRHGWDISRTDGPGGIREYFLTPRERQRIARRLGKGVA